MPARPWFTSFLLLIVNHPLELEDVLSHRRATAKIALAVFLDACIGALAMFVVIAVPVVMIRGGSLSAQTVLFGLGTFGVYCAGRELYWLSHQSPVASTLLWGGTIYVVEDASDRIGLTTEIGVAQHTDIGGAVEATVPGVRFFIRPELRPFKPEYRNEQIGWSARAIAVSLRTQSGLAESDQQRDYPTDQD